MFCEFATRPPLPNSNNYNAGESRDEPGVLDKVQRHNSLSTISQSSCLSEFSLFTGGIWADSISFYNHFSPCECWLFPHDEPVEKNLLNHSTKSVVLIEQRLAICCFSCCPTPPMAQIVKFLDALWKTNISPSVFSQLFSVVLGSQHGAERKRRHPSQQRCSKQKSAYLCQQIRRESLLHPLPFYLYTDAVFFFFREEEQL